MEETQAKTEEAAQRNVLRKEVLGIGDAIAQSIALLALVMGVALSTSFPHCSAIFISTSTGLSSTAS